jgi:DNA invertase Pin-like site-specific DNA recombinase
MGKLAIYARVSTELLQDFDRQISDLKRVILAEQELNSAFDFDSDVEIYAEKLSGFKSSTDRPELQKLLDKIDQEPTSITKIYITEISRLGRDPSQTRKLVDKLSDLKIPLYIQSIKQSSIDADGNRNMIMNIICILVKSHLNYYL